MATQQLNEFRLIRDLSHRARETLLAYIDCYLRSLIPALNSIFPAASSILGNFRDDFSLTPATLHPERSQPPKFQWQ
jgi:hypothetical protein